MLHTLPSLKKVIRLTQTFSIRSQTIHKMSVAGSHVHVLTKTLGEKESYVAPAFLKSLFSKPNLLCYSCQPAQHVREGSRTIWSCPEPIWLGELLKLLYSTQTDPDTGLLLVVSDIDKHSGILNPLQCIIDYMKTYLLNFCFQIFSKCSNHKLCF